MRLNLRHPCNNNTDNNININNKQKSLHDAFEVLRGSPEGEDSALEVRGAFVVEADRRVRSGVFILRALCLFWRFWAREKTHQLGERHAHVAPFINRLFNIMSKHHTVELSSTSEQLVQIVEQ